MCMVFRTLGTVRLWTLSSHNSIQFDHLILTPCASWPVQISWALLHGNFVIWMVLHLSFSRQLDSFLFPAFLALFQLCRHFGFILHFRWLLLYKSPICVFRVQLIKNSVLKRTELYYTFCTIAKLNCSDVRLLWVLVQIMILNLMCVERS